MAKRKDRQKTGLAGELFVAAELLKRDYQVSLTLGNAKAIDLFVYNEDINRAFDVQVKTLRRSNCYILSPKNIIPKRVYIFVMLNTIDRPVEYFIISGKKILENKEILYGKNLQENNPFSAIRIGQIRKYKDRWEIFEDN